MLSPRIHSPMPAALYRPLEVCCCILIGTKICVKLTMGQHQTCVLSIHGPMSMVLYRQVAWSMLLHHQ